EKAVLGEGALLMAGGSMMVLGLVGQANFIILGLSAVFFADPAATIFGVAFGRAKLPYNKNKSWAGSLAYFAVLGAIGFELVGLIGVALAAALAFIESLDASLDDNASTSIAFIVLVKLALL
ncbi:MAG: hypothetical protein QXN59_03260, partial [Candidatus Micrarchaeaceae archaeon]